MDRLWRRIDEEPAGSGHAWTASVAAVGAVLLATAVSVLLAREIGLRLPYALGNAAVLPATLLGGVGPGLLALALHQVLLAWPALHEAGAPADALMRATTIVTELGAVALAETVRRARLAAHTQSVRLKRREAHLQSIFDAIPAPMLVLDESGTICAVSRAAEALFASSKIDLYGTSIERLLPLDLPRGAGLHALAERLGRFHEREVRAPRADGDDLILRLSCALASTDTGALLTLHTRDVTEETRRSVQLHELQDSLVTNSRLTALGEMGAAIAHELNQPLASAANYLGAAQRYAARAEAPAEWVDAVALASAEIMRGGAVLRRLRGFVGRNTPEYASAPVGEVMREAALLARFPAQEADAELVVRVEDEGAHVVCDRSQVQQVLVNLARNAAEAVRGGDQRVVTLRTRSRGQGVLFSVEDTGPGVDPRCLPRLFEHFNTSKHEGMGVGLAVCRSIVETHGGRIWLERSDAAGACFSFTLEAQDAA